MFQCVVLQPLKVKYENELMIIDKGRGSNLPCFSLVVTHIVKHTVSP